MIFISYRRRDSTTAASWLHDTLVAVFGKPTIFLDYSTIGPGEQWPESIQNGLEISSVMLVLIGSQWLRCQDSNGRRLLDIPADWVRREIEYALTKNKAIIPVLLDGEKMPAKEALPASISELANRQAVTIASTNWREDTKKLIDELTRTGLKQNGIIEEIIARSEFRACRTGPPPLSADQLVVALQQIPSWSRTPYDDGECISRRFEFLSFEDAIHFMSSASRTISKLDHHPDWRQSWKALDVRLTTFDHGHRLSPLDIELAQFFDELFVSYR